MKLARKTWLIPIVLLLAVPSIMYVVYAEYWAELYPSHGSVNTEIFLQVRGLGGQLYLYWDDILLGIFSANVPDFAGFDIYFYPPNEHPYSDLGNHTVFLHVFYKYWDGHDIYVEWNSTLNFEITEYFPCDEYLALNATYTGLLANYSDLLDDYNSLLVDHNTLQADYNNLQSNYNLLLADYSDLLSSYNTLASNHDSLSSNYYDLESSYENLSSTYSDLLAVYSQLQSNYDSLQGNYDSFSGDLNNLQAAYSSLLANYTSLQADYNSTCSNYHTLEVDYNSLESTYSNLETNYNSLNSDYNDLDSKHDTLMSDLGFTKNLSYVFIITTLIFIASTVYLAMRRPKAKPKAKAT
jgi:archaellum component FlaC